MGKGGGKRRGEGWGGEGEGKRGREWGVVGVLGWEFLDYNIYWKKKKGKIIRNIYIKENKKILVNFLKLWG
ncbi:hypothetical protein [Klebsiella variicola]|uniref:hypothetical protein n=1 Tax=Klebsiella variicola TaxID=244366 RepID=UPI00203CC103|nr:hypothetical protein [Klebsiella variicola]USC04288.1 hypothetical protein KU664_14855 [Klebsiella variicola]